RWLRDGSGSGGAATPAAMCWWSPRSTGGARRAGGRAPRSAGAATRVRRCGGGSSPGRGGSSAPAAAPRCPAGPPAEVPVGAGSRRAPSGVPTADSWQWFTETGKTRAPAWLNEVTLRSVEMFTEYEPVTYLPYISPAPLLLVVAEGDHLVPAELAIAAYEKAHHPKELVILPVGH